LSIDLFSADCFFQANPKAQAEQVAEYFAELATHFQQKGFAQLDIFLDPNPTHKQKMQTAFHKLTAELPIKVRFHLMAAYSPKLNLVEYAIHLIRQKVLHHADCQRSLADFESAINQCCLDGKLLSKEQIVNILVHIESLVLQFSNQSPKRE
jgi:hypothetical protein